MIDGISFYLPGLSYDLFPGITFEQKGNSEITFMGRIRIQKGIGGLWISCSLGKMINGENISPIDRHGVKRAIEEIEKTINFDLHGIPLSSIEIGGSFIMDRPPPDYLHLFGLHSRYEKRPHIHPNFGLTGILYVLEYSDYSFQIYNKSLEIKRKKQLVPEVYRNSHILRLELKVKRKRGLEAWFGKEGKKKNLSPHDLYEQTIYKTLKEKFYNFYQGIEKLDKTFLFGCGLKGIVKPDEIKTLFAQLYYQEDPDKCMGLITNLKAAGNLTNNSLWRIKKMYQFPDSSTGYDSIDNPLIQELDAKVLAAIETD